MCGNAIGLNPDSLKSLGPNPDFSKSCDPAGPEVKKEPGQILWDCMYQHDRRWFFNFFPSIAKIYTQHTHTFSSSLV